MPQLRIHFPKANGEVRSRFIVSGKVRLPAAPLGVYGVLLDRGTDTVRARGKTILFHQPSPRRGHANPDAEPKYKWAIAFDLTAGGGVPAGDYDLVITSLTGEGARVRSDTIEPASATVDDSERRPIKVVSAPAPAARTTIVIDWPQSGDSIADHRDYFVAYGSFASGHNAESATMNNIAAEYIYSESGFWSAQFPPLSQGTTYTLVVVDQANHNDTKSDLTT